jgi:hypothetical protein
VKPCGDRCANFLNGACGALSPSATEGTVLAMPCVVRWTVPACSRASRALARRRSSQLESSNERPGASVSNVGPSWNGQIARPC